MILGIGTDITEVKRFKKWLDNPQMIERFFNQNELQQNGCESSKCQHYAARFAAKEAFSKALGTGLCGFELKDVYIQKNDEGKPFLKVQNSAEKILKEKFGECRIHVSLSHEKEYATAFVIIESLD